MAFGIGVNALLQGFTQGLGAGKTVMTAFEESKKKDEAAEAANAAKEARATDVAARVTTVPGADGQPGSFRVGERTFANQAEATRAAEQQVGSFMDYYRRVGAPRVMERMVASGDTEGAANFSRFIESDRSQAGMRDWAGAVRAAQWGDAQGFSRHMERAYNNNDYFGDGNTLARSRLITGADGTTTGMEVVLRGRDGTERTQTFNGMSDLYRAGVGFLAPDKAFEVMRQEQRTADTARTAVAREGRQFGRQLQLRAVDEGYRIGAENRGLDRTVDTEGRTDVRDRAREGRSETRAIAGETRRQDAALELEGVRGQTREAERAEAARRRTDATEGPERQRRDLEAIRRSMEASDPRFSRLTPEEQARKAMEVYEAQRRAVRGAAPPSAAPSAGGRGVTVYNP